MTGTAAMDTELHSLKVYVNGLKRFAVDVCTAALGSLTQA